MSNLKTIARCAPSTWMTGFKKAMKSAGYMVESTPDTVVVKNGDDVVARGLKMGRMGWMVRASEDVVRPHSSSTSDHTCDHIIVW